MLGIAVMQCSMAHAEECRPHDLRSSLTLHHNKNCPPAPVKRKTLSREEQQELRRTLREQAPKQPMRKISPLQRTTGKKP